MASATAIVRRLIQTSDCSQFSYRSFGGSKVPYRSFEAPHRNDSEDEEKWE
jgi:hypothetical protein